MIVYHLVDTQVLLNYDGGKKVKGRKRHILTDTLGNLLEVVISAAHLNDRQGAKILITQLEHQMALHLLKIWVDKGNRSDHHNWFAVQPRCCVVERTFAWFGLVNFQTGSYSPTASISKLS